MEHLLQSTLCNRRTINEDGTAQEWIKLNVRDPSDRKVVVTLQKGKSL